MFRHQVTLSVQILQAAQNPDQATTDALRRHSSMSFLITKEIEIIRKEKKIEKARRVGTRQEKGNRRRRWGIHAAENLGVCLGVAATGPLQSLLN